MCGQAAAGQARGVAPLVGGHQLPLHRMDASGWRALPRSRLASLAPALCSSWEAWGDKGGGEGAMGWAGG